jgi:hypothetical protein
MSKGSWEKIGTVLDNWKKDLQEMPEEDRKKYLEEINSNVSIANREYKDSIDKGSRCFCCYCRSERGYLK